jgi:hypothetical protein
MSLRYLSFTLCLLLLLLTGSAFAQNPIRLKMSGKLSLKIFRDSQDYTTDDAVVNGLTVSFFVDDFDYTVSKNRISMKTSDGKKPRCRLKASNLVLCTYSYFRDFAEDDGSTSTCEIQEARFVKLLSRTKAFVQYEEYWYCDDNYHRSEVFAGALNIKVKR